jgi:hypothetical protein
MINRAIGAWSCKKAIQSPVVSVEALTPCDPASVEEKRLAPSSEREHPVAK